MKFPETIQTERLILRPWRESDAAALYHCARDPQVGLPCGWMPHTSEDYSREVIRTILSADGTYAVTLPETDLAIGSVSLQPTTNPECIGHLMLGYWLGADWWGNEYMPEAAGALLRCGFEDLGLTEIWCSHFEENHNSHRVIKKLGFEYRFQCRELAPFLGQMKNVWYYVKTP